jgi:hypothetical protein
VAFLFLSLRLRLAALGHPTKESSTGKKQVGEDENRDADAGREGQVLMTGISININTANPTASAESAVTPGQEETAEGSGRHQPMGSRPTSCMMPFILSAMRDADGKTRNGTSME